MSDAVLYEVRGRTAWLTINRPKSRNAMSADVRAGLWAGFRQFNEDATASVLVLTGAGDKAFCAGGDLKEMASGHLEAPPSNFVPNLGRNITVEKPVISAVNGAAIAGGFMLVQNSDLCIAADTATFAITEARVGRGVPWAAPLSWMISPKIAMELFLLGESISAQRAFEIGLVNRVVPKDDLNDAAQEMAEKIASNAPMVVRAMKRLVYEAAGKSLDSAYKLAYPLFDDVYLSEDAQEGPRAFQEKRPPRWTGR
jgi:enoyl-CoA hydratase/carnithine racemase